MVKLKKKALSAYEMDWFTDLTISTNGGPEDDYNIQLIENLLILHHEDSAKMGCIRKLDVIPPVEAQVAALVVLQVRRPHGTMSVQIRFGSGESKTAFLDRVFPDRNQDSGNPSGSLASSDSSD